MWIWRITTKKLKIYWKSKKILCFCLFSCFWEKYTCFSSNQMIFCSFDHKPSKSKIFFQGIAGNSWEFQLGAFNSGEFRGIPGHSGELMGKHVFFCTKTENILVLTGKKMFFKVFPLDFFWIYSMLVKRFFHFLCKFLYFQTGSRLENPTTNAQI